MAATRTRIENRNNRNDGKDPDLATVGGLAAGAAVGSLLGPLGAAVGAVVGGVAGKNVDRRMARGETALPRPVKRAGAKLRSVSKKIKSSAKKALTSTRRSIAKVTKKPAAKRKR